MTSQDLTERGRRTSRRAAAQGGTQAVDRAALLLAKVVHGRGPVSFTELTAASGLAKSTTSRLLMALERHQLVRRDVGGRFWPGELFVRYAWRGTAGTDLVAIAQPFLEQLGERTGETINLGIASGGPATGGAGRSGPADGGSGWSGTADGGAGRRGTADGSAGWSATANGGTGRSGTADGGAAAGGTARAGGGGAGGDTWPAGQVVAQVNSRYMIGGTNWVGLAVPLHCSALGKVLLAFGAADVPAAPFEARTPRTITSRAALDAELARVRERGWAVTDQELEPGLVAVAAPVFAGGPAAIAAISVSAPSSRLTPAQLPAVAAACVAAAAGLSETLAGRHP